MAILRDGAPEPVGCPPFAIGWGALVEAEEGLCIKGIPGITGLQVVQGDDALLPQLGEERASRAVVPVHGDEHAGVVSFEDEDKREKDRVESSQR